MLKYCAPLSFAGSPGVFLACLKSGYIVLIFKSGDKKNYRPIAILSAIAKVNSRVGPIVLDQLYFPSQEVYNHSNNTAFYAIVLLYPVLLNFRTLLCLPLDSCQVNCVYLYFSKAFDKVKHCLSIVKLKG